MTDTQRLHPTGRLVPDELDEAMVRAVVDAFYARARRDEVVGPVFNRVIAPEDWPAHLDKIADFWSSMLLGTGRYMGRPMPRHIAIPELADTHFQRWLTLFRMTVEELCPPAVAALFVERAETIGNNFRIRIAQFRGEDPRQLKLMRAGTAL
ncbi:MAG: group III truncated hemoglobin [Devosia sp.]|uniref:group III truncated hemoglobin n=1 Tax=Devosia sp. TaxID=1871048 RepID=UPI001AD0DF3E|nr:group III truncated hemoglobin [Devosia sp.]MBN9309759.1 group III truncated hemoglobin [Devosia sp.]MBN9317564.1 group III truncated hemoglobin [Devosia sp.]